MSALQFALLAWTICGILCWIGLRWVAGRRICGLALEVAVFATVVVAMPIALYGIVYIDLFDPPKYRFHFGFLVYEYEREEDKA